MNSLKAAFEIVPIARIREENPAVRTFFFDYPLNAKPGQFVMIWVPGYNEKPMSVAYSDSQGFGVTIAKIGPFSEELFKLKKGNRLGVRGPYGTAYTLPRNAKRVAMVGGGFGSAPLRFLTEHAVKRGIHVDFLQGARSEDKLLLIDEIKKLGAHPHVSTNDGSFGHKGLVTDVLEKLLETNPFDAVYTCGPELMMKAVGEFAQKKGVYCEISVERYMKCGFGVCGQCDCGGFLSCMEGTVVDFNKIKDNPEFGVLHRDGAGLKHYFK